MGSMFFEFAEWPMFFFSPFLNKVLQSIFSYYYIYFLYILLFLGFCVKFFCFFQLDPVSLFPPYYQRSFLYFSYDYRRPDGDVIRIKAKSPYKSCFRRINASGPDHKSPTYFFLDRGIVSLLSAFFRQSFSYVSLSIPFRFCDPFFSSFFSLSLVVWLAFGEAVKPTFFSNVSCT